MQNIFQLEIYHINIKVNGNNKTFTISNNKKIKAYNIKMYIKMVVLTNSLGEKPHYIH
jgi:hypothetical protein